MRELAQVLAQRLRLAGDLDLAAVAASTPGFVGADLAALTQEAAAIAVQRIFAQLEGEGPGQAQVRLMLSRACVHERV